MTESFCSRCWVIHYVKQLADNMGFDSQWDKAATEKAFRNEGIFKMISNQIFPKP